MRAILLIAFSLILAGGCSTTPYSTFNGELISRIDPNTYGVVLVALDGKAYPEGRSQMKLTPGFHVLEIASTKADRTGALRYQSLPINVLPCTKYSFVAKQASYFGNRDWQLIPTEQIPIPGCGPSMASPAA